MTAAAAAATGLPRGIPVAAGTIDSWAEVAASGLRAPGEALLVYGTTMFLVEVATAAAPDPHLWSTAAFAPGARNLAAGIGSAGALSVWLRELSAGAPFEELFAEAAAVGPGAGGLLALPYFNGERTPLFDPDARGVLIGLTTAHGRGHVLRALVEGAAFAVRHNLDVMRAAGAAVEALRASGGGARGGLWPAVVSDVTGLPQRSLAGGRRRRPTATRSWRPSPSAKPTSRPPGRASRSRPRRTRRRRRSTTSCTACTAGCTRRRRRRRTPWRGCNGSGDT